MLKDNLRLAMKLADLTQEELGKKLGVTKQAVSRWATGSVINIPYDKIVKISEICGVTPAFLFGWNEDEHNPTVDKSAQMMVIFGTTKDITDEMLNEVLSYAKYIKLKYSKSDI